MQDLDLLIISIRKLQQPQYMLLNIQFDAMVLPEVKGCFTNELNLSYKKTVRHISGFLKTVR